MLRGILGDLLQLTTSPPIPIQIPTLSLPTQITSPSHEGEGGRGREGGEGGKGEGGGGGGGMEEWRSGNSYAGLPMLLYGYFNFVENSFSQVNKNSKKIFIR
ncbi:hypothetical protein V1477_002329 [Vespula maculifrons]|uniref:Uncharacterized protein n=1 Tax=Vespula maculifrons TaxID=7453 RepID=A0ABD2CXC1_VESMC